MRDTLIPCCGTNIYIFVGAVVVWVCVCVFFSFFMREHEAKQKLSDTFRNEAKYSGSGPFGIVVGIVQGFLLSSKH